MTNSLNRAPRSTLLLGVIVLLVALFSVILFGGSLLYHLFGSTKNTAVTFIAARSLFWICLFLAWLFSFSIEKQPLLIWEEKKYSFGAILLSVVAIFALLIVGCGIISATLMKAGFSRTSLRFDHMLTLFRGNYFVIFFTALTAGFVEELTFRGYLLPRMTILFKSPVISVLLSSILFGLLHFGYGTFLQIAAPFFIGLVFAFYYYEFRNIKVLIFCHIMWDLSAIIINLYRK